MDILISSLKLVLENNVIGYKQYNSRMKGFIGELDLSNWMRENRQNIHVLTGGYFINPHFGEDNERMSIDDSIYLTISQDNRNNYLDVYNRISNLDCQALYFLEWDSTVPFENWQEIDCMGIGVPIKIPNYRIFEYRNGIFFKTNIEVFLNHYPPRPDNLPRRFIAENAVLETNNRLRRFNFNSILDIYVQRVFFDGFIGIRRNHGMLSDIDMIITSDNGDMKFIEVKEKNLARNGAFGMDVHRINELVMLSDLTGTPVYYIVKQINNQTERQFVAWRSIEIHNFNNNADENIVNGGQGMRGDGAQNPTRLCNQNFFSLIT